MNRLLPRYILPRLLLILAASLIICYRRDMKKPSDEHTKQDLLSGSLDSKLAALEREIIQSRFKILIVSAPEHAVKLDSLVQRTLKYAKVYITTDIDEALRWVKRHKLDLILSSYRFNVGSEDGVDLFNHLKTIQYSGDFRLCNNYSEHELVHLHRAGIHTVNYPPTLDNCRTAIYTSYLAWLTGKLNE